MTQKNTPSAESFNEKLKKLKDAGILLTDIDRDENIVTVDLEKSKIFFRDYKSKNLINKNKYIECQVYTYLDLIDKEAETIVSCAMNEFERTLLEKHSGKSSDEFSLKMLKAFIPSEGEQLKLAKKLAKDEIDSRYLTKYNCLTYGNTESINGLFLSPI